MITEEEFNVWIENPVTCKLVSVLKEKQKELLDAREDLFQALCHSDPVRRDAARYKAVSLLDCCRLIDGLLSINISVFNKE